MQRNWEEALEPAEHYRGAIIMCDAPFYSSKEGPDCNAKEKKMSQGKTILICDDSILARKQLMDAISEVVEDANFVQATNGKEAVDTFNAEHPDLVFLDIVMPVMDGVNAVTEIIKAHPDAKLIIVSSIGTQNELMAAIKAGAKDFIQKPFSKEHIKEVLDYYLKE